MNNSSGLDRGRSTRRLCAAVGATVLLVGGCGGPPAVDPALVGAWEMTVPGGRWTLTVDAGGHYQFASEGAAAASHSGEISARDGQWTMHATSVVLDDHGRYSVAADGALELTGNRGPLHWGRAAANAVPAAATAVLQSAGSTVSAFAVPSAPGQAVAPQPMPPPRVVAPAPVAGPVVARTGGAALPDTIDPCVLVTAAEAGGLLGAAVQAERTTPQPHQQNDCLYRVKREDRSLSVTTYNGGGLDTKAWLDRQRSQGGTAIDGLGDGAVFHYNAALGITSVGFVIGTSSFTLTIGGVPRDRAEPAARELSATMAKRATSSAGYQTPGLERFAGTWLATTQNNVKLVFWIERDGRVRLQTTGGFQGQMALNGANWELTQPFDKTVTGTYAVSGDALKIGGQTLVADLARVACGKSPTKVQVPFDFTVMIVGRLNGKGLSAINPTADGKGFDARLAGLWEGEGTASGRHVLVLASLDDRGRSVIALFPTLTGTFEASDGKYKLALGGSDVTSGTYRFLGGSSEGTVQLTEGDTTYTLAPYDRNKKRPYDSPILGHCR